MRIAILGSGAVGGYYGARLAHAGHEVTFVARGAHLQAIRERGLEVRCQLGDLLVRARAEENTTAVGAVDLVLFAVKTYDVGSALATLAPLVGPDTNVLTLQNGVDSPHQVAGAIGERHVLGGATYIAVALARPGVIEHTGTTRRIVFGEAFGARAVVSPRVAAIREILAGADIQADAVADAWSALWKKFIFLAPIAGFTAAARLPVGPLRAVETFSDAFMVAAREVEAVARAEGVDPGLDPAGAALSYVSGQAPSVRSSLLIDLQAGKRLEVDALLGTIVRRGRSHGVPTPIIAALFTVLEPYEHGTVEGRA